MKDMVKLTIRESTEDRELGSFWLGEQVPEHIPMGCSVFMFDESGTFKGLDVVVELPPFNGVGNPVRERVEQHLNLSVIDQMILASVVDHYNNNPPNEVYVLLHELHTGVGQKPAPKDVVSDNTLSLEDKNDD